jgi:L-cystine uptake protein TcyP (sodium:dicarboxylate symporter family)
MFVVGRLSSPHDAAPLPLVPAASLLMTTDVIRPAVRQHQPWYNILYIQVLIAIALGIVIGHFYPNLGKELKPLGDGFIALIKMMIAPVIFAPWCTAFPRWAT